MKNRLLVAFLLLVSMTVIVSCIPIVHSVYRCGLRNRTSDTLFLFLDPSTLFDTSFIYWEEADAKYTQSGDTTTIYVNGKKTIVYKMTCALPDSTVGSLDIFEYFPYDTGYIYAVKWNDVTRYSAKDIYDKQLYKTKKITKDDFEDNIYEYRYE